jgi:hypothetical protein
MDSIRVFDLRSDPSADVLSLETNRRVTAVLHSDEVTQLLLLNGGSEVEHLHVDVVVPAVREPLCFGSHSVEPGRFVVVDVARPTRSVRLRVRVIGGPQPIVIEERASKLYVPLARLATAAALAIGFGSLLLLSNGPQRIAKQPPPPTSAPAVAKAPHSARKQPHVAKIPVPAPVVAASMPAETANEPPRPIVRPPVVAVSTLQGHVVNGQPITIAFNSTGQQVHIVAKIGPRTIEDRIIGASRGKLVFQPPPSSDIRVLTINASAENKGVTSSRHAIVILLPEIPQAPPITNL